MDFFIFTHTLISVRDGFRVRDTGEVKCRGRWGFWGKGGFRVRGEFRVWDKGGFRVKVDWG